jgi:NDP-sugar pyrophosphorylase family protein
METLLICPAARPAVGSWSRFAPLAALPLLGQSLIEYWLAHLALAGRKNVHVLADDRPDQIAALVNEGARWGIQAKVIAEARELTPAQAQFKYGNSFAGSLDEITVLDHFPGMAEAPLFDSYAGWFSALLAWMPHARTPDRVGVREIQPGIWVASHARVAPSAQLRAPCWIGQSTFIAANAVIGPNAIVEDRAFVDTGAELSGSVVGPDTFVGRLASLHDSFAWGSTLVNWRSNSVNQVPDAFLLCALRHSTPPASMDNFLSRLGELYSRNKDDLQMLWKQLLINKGG